MDSWWEFTFIVDGTRSVCKTSYVKKVVTNRRQRFHYSPGYRFQELPSRRRYFTIFFFNNELENTKLRV